MAANSGQEALEMPGELGQSLAAGSWAVLGIVVEGESISIGDVNLWDHHWQPLKADVYLPHPAYPQQKHRLDIYRIESGGRTILFAAGEVSAGVWAFYQPARSR
jgi:hypothetical protein